MAWCMVTGDGREIEMVWELGMNELVLKWKVRYINYVESEASTGS